MQALWTQPVTDREPGARMTCVDMNRITNNLNWLVERMEERQLYHGHSCDKTEWVHNDYVSWDQWNLILLVLNDVVTALNLQTAGEATFDTTYTNINTVEDLTRLARERLELYESQGDCGKYVDTEVYPGADGYFPCGVQEPWDPPNKRIRHYCDTEIYLGEAANVGGVE